MDSITLMHVPIIWTNFTGTAGIYNKEGERSFNVVIEDEETARTLSLEGWNVKEMKVMEEGDDIRWHIPVKVNFASPWPPRIFKVNAEGTKKTLLDETTVRMLDLLRVEWADVELNPYEWESPDGNSSGVSAYLATMYAVTEVNPLDEIWEAKEAESLLGEQSIEE